VTDAAGWPKGLPAARLLLVVGEPASPKLSFAGLKAGSGALLGGAGLVGAAARGAAALACFACSTADSACSRAATYQPLHA
jgi:hypothetical protein